MEAQLASYIVFIEFSSGGFFREGKCNYEHQEDKKRHRTADKFHEWCLQYCARLKKIIKIQIEENHIHAWEACVYVCKVRISISARKVLALPLLLKCRNSR